MTTEGVRVLWDDLPVRRAGGVPDACGVLIERWRDGRWWFHASRDFFLTPGRNRRRAEEWVSETQGES